MRGYDWRDTFVIALAVVLVVVAITWAVAWGCVSADQNKTDRVVACAQAVDDRRASADLAHFIEECRK